MDFASEFSRNSAVFRHFRRIRFRLVLAKITGACLFVLLFSLWAVDIKYIGSVICAVATIAALQELFVAIGNIAAE